MATVSVRYIVDDVMPQSPFTVNGSGSARNAPGPDLCDALSRRPPSRVERSERGGRRWTRDARGSQPEPGGLVPRSTEVADLDGLGDELSEAGSHFRNEIVNGVGGKAGSNR